MFPGTDLHCFAIPEMEAYVDSLSDRMTQNGYDAGIRLLAWYVKLTYALRMHPEDVSKGKTRVESLLSIMILMW